MYGTGICQNVLFVTITLENFVPAGHPLHERMVHALLLQVRCQQGLKLFRQIAV